MQASMNTQAHARTHTRTPHTTHHITSCSPLVLGSARMRPATFAIGICQAVCTMTFYAITFSEQLNRTIGDLYLGALLGATIELPAYILLAPFTDYFGRQMSAHHFSCSADFCYPAIPHL